MQLHRFLIAHHITRRSLVLVLVLSQLAIFASPASPARAVTCTVLNQNDSGLGSLREKIVDATCDTIVFLINSTIKLSSPLTITRALTVDGGTRAVTLSGDSNNDGIGDVRLFSVNPGITFTLKQLTVTRGKASTGGAACPTYCGGAIYAQGALLATNVVFSGNVAGAGGALYSLSSSTVLTNITFFSNTAQSGGAIYNESGSPSMRNITFTNNTATSSGGGLYNDAGSPVLTNVLFISNTAGVSGGGLHNSGGNPALTNATVSANSAGSGGGLYSAGGASVLTHVTLAGNSAITSGGGLYNDNSNPVVRNSILWGNGSVQIVDGGTSAPDVSYSVIQNGYLGAGNTSADPFLASLGNYGGSMHTIAVLPGSSAIGATSSNCAASDQRGVVRSSPICDVGAFESQGFMLNKTGGDNQSTDTNIEFAIPLGLSVSPISANEPVNGGRVTFTSPVSGASAAIHGSPATIVSGAVSVTATANNTPGLYAVVASATGAANVNVNLTNTCGAAVTVTNDHDDGAGSLRRAVNTACTGGAITFGSDFSIAVASPLTVVKDVTIDGAGRAVTVRGHDTNQVFLVPQGMSATLQHLTLTNGAIPLAGDGIGVENAGALIVADSVFTGSHGTRGAIANTGVLTVMNSLFLGNYALCNAGAEVGGGIFNRGALYVTGATFSRNRAASLALCLGAGGAIYNAPGYTATVANSAFSDNSAAHVGGAIFNAGAMTVTNSTFAGNSLFVGLTGGSAIYNQGALSITNSTISGGNVADAGTSNILNDGGLLTMRNSIVANAATGDNCAGAMGGSYNLADDDTCGAGFTRSSSLLLGVLGNYGGGALTLPLLPGSAAIDAGNDVACAAAPVGNVDQRGVARTHGAHCDAGAFESRGFALSNLTGTPQTATIHTAFALPLGLRVLANQPGEPVDGGRVTFTAPASGPSTTFAPTTTAAVVSGVVGVSVSANGVVGGPYNVVAGTAGASNVTFSLRNKLEADTSIALAASANPSVAGQPVTLTAHVTSGGAPVTAGTVSFRDGGAILPACSAQPLNASGHAICVSSALTIGTHSLTAVFSGNATHSSSASCLLTQTVQQASTAITLASSANPVDYGQPLTVTATVNVVPPGAGTPAGTVTFYEILNGGVRRMGNAPVAVHAPQVAAGSAVFTWTTSSLSLGTHSILAVYSGNASYAGSASATFAQVVQLPGAVNKVYVFVPVASKP